MTSEHALFIPQGALVQNDGSVLFRTWAPLHDSVSLQLVSPVQMTIPLQKESLGYWWARVPGIKPGQRYMYIPGGGEARPDVASFSQPEGVHAPSEVIDLNSFEWTDQGWKGLHLPRLILYELHTGTFSPSGDFEGIIAKLDYLRELGVTGIEIMPVAQFPGTRNWGYDGVFPFAVQNSYGGAAALQRLVNEAHNRQLAVILDVVYNHLGPEGNYLNDYGPYFTDKYKTPWGPALNFDGPWCDGVRNFFLQNAYMWLHDFHIDGLRMDAVHAIFDSSARHIMEELASVAREVEAATGRKKLLIAEFDLNNPRYIQPKHKGGYGLDAQWADEWHHALHAYITGEKNGYYEDFGTLDHLKKSFETGYVYTGEYSEGRKRRFGATPTHYQNHQFIVFTQNHDHIGNRAQGDRLTGTLSVPQLKLVAAAMLLSPFTPMLFMGEEYGETNPFLYFVSHSDEKLIDMVRKGRKEEFAYFMPAGEDVPDPQDEQTFLRSKLSWQWNEGSRREIRDCYRALIRLRTSHPALQSHAPDDLLVQHHLLPGVLAIERRHRYDDALIVFNFNNEEVQYPASERSAIVFSTENGARRVARTLYIPAHAAVMLEKI